MCILYDECLPNNQLNLGLIKKTKYGPFFCAGKMIFIIACSFVSILSVLSPWWGIHTSELAGPPRGGQVFRHFQILCFELGMNMQTRSDNTLSDWIQGSKQFKGMVKNVLSFQQYHLPQYWRKEGKSRNVAKLFKRHHSISRWFGQH